MVLLSMVVRIWCRWFGLIEMNRFGFVCVVMFVLVVVKWVMFLCSRGVIGIVLVEGWDLGWLVWVRVSSWLVSLLSWWVFLSVECRVVFSWLVGLGWCSVV